MSKRAEKLAGIILNHSLNVQKGERLTISASDFSSIELLEPLYEQAILKGALVNLDIFTGNFSVGRADFGNFAKTFYKNASKAQLEDVSLYSLQTDWADKVVKIVSIHDKNFLSKINSSKISLRQSALRPVSDKMLQKPWCLTYYPTKALAENSGMTLDEFTDFYYDACNVDYADMDAEILPLQELLDKGERVEIKGDGIELSYNIKNRLSLGVDNGKHNIPDGECFIAPMENSTEGFIEFELPQIYNGNEVEGIKLEFQKGKIVKYSSKSNSKFLKSIFESHDGNKRIGEFGIGMNKKITNYIKDILFDEKIYGTVHFALGMSYPYKRGGGKNQAPIHWDMIKDLRHKGSIISVDGTIIFKDGKLQKLKN
ncbi:MAG TPA: aminopeptidase [Candidatus Dojkabacteria bacterium]|nr:aminopeptidase [Candidatus Dojkabacteria bacterium]HRO65506.1 aminopeptidase [Candidatus Dojkabacteria bacterium]HRP37200.1 aminopeptidase [Candidatus Dojkabacteria bacterium]HRP51397.1 aminopeptidase [Candidatus Dojkabacteria bacterium]